MSTPSHIVVLGMFDLQQLDRARPIRIHNMHAALTSLTPTTLLSGNRTPRRFAIMRFLWRGGLRHTRAVYVEASTSTATEIDLLFLALARRRSLPIAVYIPDAYQLFPHLYPRRGWKVTLLDWGWRRSIEAYLRLADALLFPSSGLAAHFGSSQAFTFLKKKKNIEKFGLLPPGGRANRGWIPPSCEPPIVVFAGEASFRYGSDLLLHAMEQVVVRHPTTRCHFISSNVDFIRDHPSRHAFWLTVESRTFDELPEILSSATIAVVPLRVNTYTELAMPVKLFDYMSYGRPLVVTACRETATLVRELQAGLVVEPTAAALADGISQLIENPALARHLGGNGYRAIQTTHSWSHRAKQLLHMIEEIENQR
ncbi:MAG: glycosyltransferase [Candidatus Binatia bacterium]